MSRPGGRVSIIEPRSPRSPGSAPRPHHQASRRSAQVLGFRPCRSQTGTARHPPDGRPPVRRAPLRRRPRRSSGTLPGAGLDRSGAEVGERVVRRGPVPVGQPVGEPDDPATQRLERQRHRHGGEQRPPEPSSVASSTVRPSAPPDRRSRRPRTPRRSRHHGPADDHLDVVEPVAQHRHPDADDQGQVRHVERHARPPQLPAVVEALADDQHEERHADAGRPERDDPELLAGRAGGSAEPLQHRDDAGQKHQRDQDDAAAEDQLDVRRWHRSRPRCG